MADNQGVGARPLADQALAVPAKPASGLDASRCDPSRVRVTAADYNGHNWDGSPFSHIPSWLETALRQGSVCVKADDRDYALWAVETPTGAKIAEPGDDIVCLDGHFDVHKDSYLSAFASGMETRQGGNEVPSRSDDSPTVEDGDAQGPSQ